MSECNYLVEKDGKRLCKNGLLKNRVCVVRPGKCHMCIGYAVYQPRTTVQNAKKNEMVKRVLQSIYPEWITASDIAKRLSSRGWANTRSIACVIAHMDGIESKGDVGIVKQYRYAEETE